MTLIGSLCGFGLLNAGPMIDRLDQPTPTRRPRAAEPLPRGSNGWTRSNSANKKQNEKNNEHDADNPHSAMAITVPVTTEAAAEATQQKNDEKDDKDEPEGHGVSLHSGRCRAQDRAHSKAR
jgi:hypothetical protein